MRITVPALTACLVLSAVNAAAQDQAPMMAKSQSGVAIDTAFEWRMCAAGGLAIEGYDLVSYRSPEGPVSGQQAFSAEHDGLTYLFANQENLELFVAEPERYLPAYSGFCAITLALGRITCPDVTNFKIENDQLLLFEITGFTNGRMLWNSNPASFRTQADDNYSLISSNR